jgi:hypothetical protein
MTEICRPLGAVRNDFAYNAQRRSKQNGVLSQRLFTAESALGPTKAKTAPEGAVSVVFVSVQVNAASLSKRARTDRNRVSGEDREEVAG